MVDQKSKTELKDIENNRSEIKERFYKDISFGTGGLRGLMEAGTNRINTYTIRKATQGLANYINNDPDSSGFRSLAIAYDSRHCSSTFALEAALVLAANNIRVYLFDEMRPTPELSFSIRYLDCSAGIVITASHNPPEYNGYKIYGSDGGQITPETAQAIKEEIDKVDIFEDVLRIEKNEAIEKRFLYYIGEEIDKAYIKNVIDLSKQNDIKGYSKNLKIVYSPLHGVGQILVPRVLELLGFKDIYLVESQLIANGDFPTVTTPNPENWESLNEGIALAEKLEADIVLATDPDCDRVGVAVRNKKGRYSRFTGNQIGALLTYYILSSKEKVIARDAVVKTVVTSDLGVRICESFGARVFNTLTGFKYIGEKIKEFEDNGKYDFLFGYEESCGYLAGTFVRDKDAVIACMLIVEMAAIYKSRGRTLFEVMDELFQSYGYYSDALESYIFEDATEQEKINLIMDKFRNIGAVHRSFPYIVSIEDYQSGEKIYINPKKNETIVLPKEDMVKIHLENGSWFAARPSGTEPKLKIYFSVIGGSSKDSLMQLTDLKSRVSKFMRIE